MIVILSPSLYDASADSAIGEKMADVFNFLVGEETKHIAII